jgi:predicted MFS family arabinose efflux permease
MTAPTGLDRRRRDFELFVLASVFMGLGACVNSAAFNNYLLDRYKLDIAQRTFLEFPRELPGFLVSLFIGALAALGDVRIAALAGVAASAGMFALGWIPPMYSLMLAAVFIYSSGAHIYLPLGNSIGMGFAEEGNEGRVLGKVQASTTIALVAGAGVLMLLFRFARLSYRAAFSAGAVFYFAAAIVLFTIKPLHNREKPLRFVVKKKYARFYVLSVLYGARKQLFITFGPWMLVDLFKQPVSTMTTLFFVVSVLNIFAKPAIGRLTDRLGPGKVLRGEAIATILICLLYAYSSEIFPLSIALVVVSICYILDQTSDALAMTRAVYVKQLVEKPQDISPTLSFGISVDHVVSMTLPMLGGLVWTTAGNYGYRWIFLGGAVVASANFLVARGIKSAAGSGTDRSVPSQVPSTVR